MKIKDKRAVEIKNHEDQKGPKKIKKKSHTEKQSNQEQKEP